MKELIFIFIGGGNISLACLELLRQLLLLLLVSSYLATATAGVNEERTKRRRKRGGQHGEGYVTSTTNNTNIICGGRLQLVLEWGDARARCRRICDSRAAERNRTSLQYTPAYIRIRIHTRTHAHRHTPVRDRQHRSTGSRRPAGSTRWSAGG
eukprot:GHVU01026122.1.p2 GENE.GHVU01026122.1~~GHVU01026122.1.p2  ORF type:complete len:153 (+),score=8.31 GHVU01026122.1:940-1398(+)